MPIKIATANRKGWPVDKHQPAITADKNGQSGDWDAFLAGLNGRKSVLEYSANRNIFVQGDPADSVFYIRGGQVKLSVTSEQGKEAIVAILDANDFLGEGCLGGQPLRIETAITLTDCTLVRIERPLMSRMLHEQLNISELFVKYLLSRNIRFEGDIVDQLFNSSEKRLARILLLLSHVDAEYRSDAGLPRINQESLAQMVGTTRSRVSHFMNQFRECGCIDYKKSGDITVHSNLISVVRDGTCEPPLGQSHRMGGGNKLRLCA